MMSSYNQANALLDNAVLRLRAQKLAQATRPFQARGSRVIRCDRCLLPKKFCLCHAISPVTTNSVFCLLMYDTEPLKPSNTGRLIADILPDTSAFLWSRTQPDPQLLSLLSDTSFDPYIIFPAAYAQPERIQTQIRHHATKRPLFIILDGTWSEARKMFRKSPYLEKFPVLAIQSDEHSRYALREAQRKEQFCTVEVAINLLQQAEESDASRQLQHHFFNFRQRYLAGKANLSLDDDRISTIKKT